MKKSVLFLFAILMAISSFAQPANLRNTITPGEGETWWGYFTESDANAANFSGYGVNAVANYEAAIKIAKNDPIMGKATVKAVRIWLNSTTIPKITSLKIWKNKSLKLNANGVGFYQVVDVSTLHAGANDILLNTPLAINDSVTYFGFTMELSSQDNAVMNGGEYEANTFFFRATAQQTNWISMTGQGKLAMQLLAEGVQLPQNNAIVTTKDLGSYNCQVGDDAIIPVTIKNKGKNPITSISYTITSNNDPATVTTEVTVPINNITTGNTGTFNVSFDTSEAIKSTKAITVTKVNGVENEAAAADATASVQLIIRSSLMFEKVPVVEEFTGTWCGWCPRGFVGMETMHQVFGNKVVLIAVHNGDPMQISDYSPIMSLNSLGYPNSFIDRKYKDVDPGPTDLQSNINPLLQERPDAKIEISAKWNDAAMTKIDVETNSMFVYNEENANYGVALALIEDGMTGTTYTSGNSWAQKNYYNGMSGAPSYMSWWVTAGESVRGLEFNHVAVAAWQIKNGFDGSVPTSFEVGEAIPFNYLADISTNSKIQKKEKLSVAALLIDRSNGEILNAAQTTINPYGTVEVPSEFYMVGTFNDWNQNEDGGRLAFAATENEGIYETTGTLEAGAEFKVITPNGDGWTWYGGQDDNGVGYFLINNNLFNAPIAMVDGANFRLEKGGKYTFRINAENMTLTVVPEATVVVPGDVNGDGFVTATDVTLLYNHMLNNDDENIVNGDVDGDGNITAADVTFVYNILLGVSVPTTEHVYVLGEVNGNTWGAATGVQMNTSNGKVFTVQVTTTSIGGEYATSYFALTKALASSDDNWDEIQDKRFGPTTADQFTNFVISDAVLGQEIPLVTEDWRAFEAPTGTVYNLTVDLEHMTIVITKVNP